LGDSVYDTKGERKVEATRIKEKNKKTNNTYNRKKDTAKSKGL